MSEGNGNITAESQNGHQNGSKPPRKKRRYNPTKLTAVFIKRVENLAAKGLNQAQIAEVLNVGASTMSIWKTKDSALSEKFVKALAKGAAIGLERRLCRIEKHGKKSWQADAWWAARRFPEQWGDKSSMRLANPDGTPLQPASVTTVVAPNIMFVQPDKKELGNGHDTIELGNGDT